ncbi:MAG TPA: hypothetical protein VFM88_17445 [Vicinamibacteria bacterium]|nr:hypothetical protein [Vicinamibacteria bacterium]
MGWFSGSGRPSAPEPKAPEEHRSLALPQLLRGLRPESHPSLLDLGMAVGSNLEFLAAYSCRVRIADLYRSLQAEPPESREPDVFPALLPRLLPLEPSESFDVLLAWDLFNYLRRDQTTALMTWLAPACTERTIVFALISTLPQIPGVPLRFRIVDDQHLAWGGLSRTTRPSPRFTQPDLRKMAPGFRVRNSYILRSGIQEYLLERGTQKSVATAVPVARSARGLVVR